MAEISLTEQKECGHVPLVVHFSKVLPSESIDGITTRDSGGTTKIKHLAIIPDGNRRWAQEHGYCGREVYKEGIQRLYENLEYLANCKINYFTFWSSSFVNLKDRSSNMLNVFDTLYKENFEKLLNEKLIWDRKVRIEVYGAWRGLLKSETEELIDKIVSETKNHKGMKFVILIGYDGRLERGCAILSLINAIENRKIVSPSDSLVADDILRSYSWTSILPRVDLIIRTGSWKDPHMSADFLTLLSGEAQFVFPPVLWPDFTVKDLEISLANFYNRERRYGK